MPNHKNFKKHEIIYKILNNQKVEGGKMRQELLDKFKIWWLNRRHKRQRIKGLSMSEKTLNAYLTILKKIPDIEVREDSNEDEMIRFIRELIKNNFNPIYPQVIFAIRSYLKMYENGSENPIVNRKARTIRMAIDYPIYKDIKGTQQLFLEKFLSKREIRLVINEIQNIDLPHNIPKEKMVILLQMLYDTGCRIGELANIKKKDIDFTTGDVMIVGKGKYIRKVRVESNTLHLLKNYIQNINDEELIFGWNVETIKRYFKEIMKLISRRQLNREIRKKLTKVSPHWFRHSRATHLAIVWKDVIKLKDYMGWSDIKMAEVYVTNLTILPSEILAYKSTNLWEN
jgi:integrase